MAERIVHFQPLGRRIESREGATLLELARDSGVSIESICSSAGKCGKCKVVIDDTCKHKGWVRAWLRCCCSITRWGSPRG